MQEGQATALDKTIKLELPAGAVGLILAALAELPFKVSGQLISAIQAEASAQMAPAGSGEHGGQEG